MHDLKIACRLYDDEKEEEALEIVDRLLKISGLPPATALQQLQQWPRELLPDPKVSSCPTGWLLVESEQGVDKPLVEFGLLGLLDAMRLRSLALSAIVFGSSLKNNKAEYAIRAFENAQLVMQVFKGLAYGEEGALWCVSAQPAMLAADPETVGLGFGMMYWAIKKFPELATHANNQHVFYCIMPQAYARCIDLDGINFYWEELSSVFARAKASGIENATSSWWLIKELMTPISKTTR